MDQGESIPAFVLEVAGLEEFIRITRMGECGDAEVGDELSCPIEPGAPEIDAWMTRTRPHMAGVG